MQREKNWTSLCSGHLVWDGCVLSPYREWGTQEHRRRSLEEEVRKEGDSGGAAEREENVSSNRKTARSKVCACVRTYE